MEGRFRDNSQDFFSIPANDEFPDEDVRNVIIVGNDDSSSVCDGNRTEISNYDHSKMDSEQFDHNYSLASSSSYGNVGPIRNRRTNVNCKRRNAKQTRSLDIHSEIKPTAVDACPKMFVHQPAAVNPMNMSKYLEQTIQLEKTNRKYRRQYQNTNSLTGKHGMFCAKCRMRFFYPTSQLHKYIEWMENVSSDDLPLPYFTCKICGFSTQLNVA
ncbi:hypothetical protein Ddc_13564 [Ditylenchus destructor]|nr:hypothetical protein Ddc_13564 [Ditylenchus destructor]